MRRFLTNRKWSLVLASLFVAGSLLLPFVRAFAQTGGSVIIGDGNPDAGSNTPPSAGDPDIPINNGRNSPKSPGRRTVVTVATVHGASVGSFASLRSAWLFQFRIATLVYRAYFLR